MLINRNSVRTLFFPRIRNLRNALSSFITPKAPSTWMDRFIRRRIPLCVVIFSKEICRSSAKGYELFIYQWLPTQSAQTDDLVCASLSNKEIIRQWLPTKQVKNVDLVGIRACEVIYFRAGGRIGSRILPPKTTKTRIQAVFSRQRTARERDFTA